MPRSARSEYYHSTRPPPSFSLSSHPAPSRLSQAVASRAQLRSSASPYLGSTLPRAPASAAASRQCKFTMSGLSSDDATGEVRLEGDVSDKAEGTQDQKKEGTGMPSPQEEEAAIKKKYGGVLPKKTPLISKDHERAYFDSADWALGKQGGNPSKPKGPLEALRPKLQPTQQHARARRSPYASADIDNDESVNLPAEDLSPNGDPNEDKSNKE